jgi:dihydroflavonol-4-reductase
MHQRVFITGGTGFIGRHVIDLLTARGTQVTLLARTDAQELPTGVAQVRGDILDDSERLAASMVGHDLLIHLAAKVSFNPRDLPELIRVNAEGTRNILTAARLAGVDRCVVVSSACTIGLSRSRTRVLAEDTPFSPRLAARNPYLQSKHTAEEFALAASRRGQSVTIVNPTTVFGPGDRTLNSGSIIKQIASARVMPVPPGGSNVVDVRDVAAGILAAAERGESGCRYILGGHNLTFSEIFNQAAAVIGRRPLMIALPTAGKTPMKAAAWVVGRVTGSRLITPQIISDTFAFKYYSSLRAEAELGWRPQDAFSQSLRDAWNYYLCEGLIAQPGRQAA